jgi:hypothetical protein
MPHANETELTKALLRMQKQRDSLVLALKPAVSGFEYDPGHSDLDDEQPIYVRMTLGEWRKARHAIAEGF